MLKKKYLFVNLIDKIIVVPPIEGQKKSQGTDDGFKDAACGSSIIKVAQQVVSGRQFGRGFTVAK